MTPIQVSLLHHAVMSGRERYLTQVIKDVCRSTGRTEVIEFIEDGIRTRARIQYRAAETLIWDIYYQLPRRHR